MDTQTWRWTRRRPRLIAPVPPEPAQVARAAYPKGHRDLRRADDLETRFTDDAFLALGPTHGPPARSPWRRALVTLRPGAEGLCARQAAPAVRRRLDWTEVRRLERPEPGCEASVLRALRPRLGAWWLESARANPRLTPFARLMADAAVASPDETSPSVSLLVRWNGGGHSQTHTGMELWRDGRPDPSSEGLKRHGYGRVMIGNRP